MVIREADFNLGRAPDSVTQSRATVARKFTFRGGRAIAICAIAMLLITGIVFGVQKTTSGISFATPYQAVLLTNGTVFYGKLRGYGTGSPVLSDVYYIVTSTNSDSKQVSNVLVKRGKELHLPDRMYLNPNQIVFVETVGINSQVAQLIAHAK